jgi:hypothetical protein
VDHVHVFAARFAVWVVGASALVACGCGVVQAAGSALGGSGARGAAVTRVGAGGLPPSPTQADFVGFPSCMLYAGSADTRVRVRAARANQVCTRLAKQLGKGWSRRARRAERILGPICRFADPRGTVELDVMDDATGGRRGHGICTSLARSGWFDLSPP